MLTLGFGYQDAVVVVQTLDDDLSVEEVMDKVTFALIPIPFMVPE